MPKRTNRFPGTAAVPAKLPQPLFSSVAELNQQARLFHDPQRPRDQGPFVIVQDAFYPDPYEIRSLALRQRFVQYLPPLPEQVGVERAQAYQAAPSWFASALLRHQGRIVSQPFFGYRYNPEWVRRALSAVTQEAILENTWDEAGDWWNGAFHLQNAHWTGDLGSVHHHYKRGDVYPGGWSGLVYLSPNAPTTAGTSIWRDKETGLCVAAQGRAFFRGNIRARFDLALLIENRFNRLVLFREHVLHRAEHGFGETAETARLTQTFFFLTDRS